MKLKIETHDRAKNAGDPSWEPKWAASANDNDAVNLWAYGRTEREAKRRLRRRLGALVDAGIEAGDDLDKELAGIDTRRAKGAKR